MYKTQYSVHYRPINQLPGVLESTFTFMHAQVRLSYIQNRLYGFMIELGSIYNSLRLVEIRPVNIVGKKHSIRDRRTQIIQ